MKDFRTRVLSADYKKWFRLLIAAGTCILVIGGGISAVLLHTTGTHSLSGPPQMQQDNGYDDNNSGQFPGDGNPDSQRPDGNMGDRSMNGYGMNGHGMMGNDMDHHGMVGHDMHHGDLLMQVMHSSQTSLASKIAVLATVVLGFLWVILAWFTIVCYLYRTSTFSRMNPVLWTVLGIIGNVFALIAFFIARNILRIRCASCGSWQDISQAYCSACGSNLKRVCAVCGAAVSQDAAYCASCGAEQQTAAPIEAVSNGDLSEPDEAIATDELTDIDETATQIDGTSSEEKCDEEGE